MRFLTFACWQVCILLILGVAAFPVPPARTVQTSSAVGHFPHASTAVCKRLQPLSMAPSRPQLKKRRRQLRKALATTVLAFGLWFQRTPAANAKFSYELSDTQTYSLRPGINKEQAQSMEEGTLPEELQDTMANKAATPPKPQEMPKNEKKTKKVDKRKKDDYYGYDEEDSDFADDFATELEVASRPATWSDQNTANALEAQKVSQFASRKQSKSVLLYIKVGLGLFTPTFGGMFVREFFRRRREEEYVKKGLEILEAQKAEYFNVTDTSTSDADVSDELKDLKKNATKTDDEDDDDDDDDDDDEDVDEDAPPRPKKPGPKRPGGGNGSSGGSPSDPGYGKPSDEDLDRLKNLFDKS